MISIVALYSCKAGEINKFLSEFYNSDFNIKNDLKWKKEYKNPIELAEIIGVFIDNKDKFDINMWVSIDKDFYINVTEHNVNDIIKYLYERFPY